MNRLLLLIALVGSLIFTSCGGEKYTYAEIETDMGTMKVKLYNSTPQHRDNFIKLASEGFYDDLLFHRVIKGFMVQGGDPESKGAPLNKSLGAGGPGYTIPAEISAMHIKGALSAARQGDAVNPEKRSSGSQFYVVQGKPQSSAQLDNFERQKKIKYPPAIRKLYEELGGTPFLDQDYTVFGEVVEGMDVIDKIANVKTQPGDRPVEDVKMKVRLLK